MKEHFAQSALTSGSLPAAPGINIANEQSIRAYIVGLWNDLYTLGILQGGVTVDGVDLEQLFNDNLVIVVDTSAGSVSGSMAFVVMGQLTSFDFDITPNSSVNI